MDTVDVEYPYIDTAKGVATAKYASSVLYWPPQPGTATPPVSCTAGAPLQAPFEQLVYVDEHT